MRTTQPVRAPDDGGAPVWTRARRKSRNPAIVFINTVMGLISAALVLFAILTIVLMVRNGGSFAKGGAQLDAWVGPKSKAVAMDQATPVEPASAPASSQPAASPPPAPASSPAPASKP